jgi:hypothetical protein
MVLVQNSLGVWSFGKQRCEDSIKIYVGDISYNVNWIKLAPVLLDVLNVWFLLSKIFLTLPRLQK